MKQIEKIVLFDLDGTLCSYDIKIEEEYNLIKSPQDQPYRMFKHKQKPEYVNERIKLIRNQNSWWEKLPRLKLGFDILEIANELGFSINILIKGPASVHNAWAEKSKWFKENIKNDYPKTKLTIAEDKGLVYGAVLVNDWIDYIQRWLEWKPKGVVIMPSSVWNREYFHPNVTRYDGTNLEQVKEKLIWVKNSPQNL